MSTRRDFIKQSTILSGALVIPGLLQATEANKHELPKLPYAYNALEPYIDANTMEIHHGKHHQAYVNNLNKALEGLDSKWQNMPLDKLLMDIDKLPNAAKTAIRNNGGGHWNHSRFWQWMSPSPNKHSEAFDQYLTKHFGSFDKFKEQFTAKALGQFGSGWAWLIEDDGRAALISTPNQDNPLMIKEYRKAKVLLGLDVWEHAYYLNYQNKRAEYILQWFNAVNWAEVESVWQKD